MTGERALGVLGGMGGLASAAFVATLYRQQGRRAEQAQPVVWLRSDPRVPDRTRCLSEGRAAELAAALAEALEQLIAAGADRLIICCVSAHAVWDRLPAAVRARTISLLDVLYATPALADRRRLVLCTQGTADARVLQRHPRFEAVAGRLIWPSGGDQARIHALLYGLKGGASPGAAAAELAALAERYGAAGVVAACTEAHLLTGRWPQGMDVVDPLMALAERLERWMAGPE